MFDHLYRLTNALGRISLVPLACGLFGMSACGRSELPAKGEERPGPRAAVVRDASEEETRRFLYSGPSEALRGSVDAGPEGFYPNGQYIAQGLAGIQGRHSVSGNIVCVSWTLRDPLDYCRTVLIGPDGAFFGHPIDKTSPADHDK